MILNKEGAQALLETAKTKLDDGKLILCAGTMPTDASLALNLGAITVLAIITNNLGEVADEEDGLVWNAPVYDFMSKPSGDTWSSSNPSPAFVGFDSGVSPKTATFALWLNREKEYTNAAIPGEMRLLFSVIGETGSGDLRLLSGNQIHASGDPVVVTTAQVQQPL